jgi:hypothetical protein
MLVAGLMPGVPGALERAASASTPAVTSTPNDPAFAQQAALQSYPTGVGITDEWAETHSLGQGVTVAVVDNGFATHPDITFDGGYDFTGDTWTANPMETPQVGCTHGLEVASVIGAMSGNLLDIAGVAPAVHVVPVKIAPCNYGAMRDGDRAMALLWAAGWPTRVRVERASTEQTAQYLAANFAPGGKLPRNQHPADIIVFPARIFQQCDDFMRSVLDAITKAGTTLVVSGPNRAEDWNADPTNCHVPGVVEVGGQESGNPLSPDTDVLAPFGNYPVLTYAWDYLGRVEPTWQLRSGTSYGAPLVAGAIALYQSARLAQHRKLLTPLGVDRLLKMTARGAGNTCIDCNACLPRCTASRFDAAAFGSSARLGGVTVKKDLSAVFTMRADLSDDTAFTGQHPKAQVGYVAKQAAGDTYLMCDFDGDGVKTPAWVSADGTWSYVDDVATTANPTEPTVHHFRYGPPAGGVIRHYVCGDFDGNGRDDPVIVDTAIADDNWHTVRIRHSPTDGNPDEETLLYQSESGIVVGDWDGRGADNLGFVVRRGANFVHFHDYLTHDYPGDPLDVDILGINGVWARPVAGNWDGRGGDTIGVWYADPTVNTWLMHNHSSGEYAPDTQIHTPALTGITPLVWR